MTAKTTETKHTSPSAAIVEIQNSVRLMCQTQKHRSTRRRYWYYPTDGAQTRKKINTFHDAFHTRGPKCSLPILNVIQKIILNNIVLP